MTCVCPLKLPAMAIRECKDDDCHIALLARSNRGRPISRRLWARLRVIAQNRALLLTAREAHA